MTTSGRGADVVSAPPALESNQDSIDIDARCGSLSLRDVIAPVAVEHSSRKHSTLKLWFLLGVVWTLPNTLIGLSIGLIGMCFGSRMHVSDRAIEFYDGGIKWLIHRFPNGQFTLAMTLGHVVIGQTKAALDLSRTHEMVHVRQYERWGPFFIPAYLLASVYVWTRGRRPYRDNPFEIEAYAVEDLRGNISDDPEAE